MRRWRLILLAAVVPCAVASTEARPAAETRPTAEAQNSGEKRINYGETAATSTQGSSTAESIRIDGPVTPQKLKEMRRLSESEGISDKDRKALIELIDVSEQQQRHLGAEPGGDVDYTRPNGYQNTKKPEGAKPFRRSIERTKAPPKPFESRMPLDFQSGISNKHSEETPRNMPSGPSPVILSAGAVQAPPDTQATQRALESERRMPSFMRSDASSSHTARKNNRSPVLEKTEELMKSGKPELAADAASEAVIKNPKDADAGIALIQALIESRKYEEAVEEASTAAQIHPHDPRVYFLRAVAFEQLGDRDSQISDLRIAASLDSDRFQKFLLAAKDGRALFDPRKGGSWKLLDVDKGTEAPKKRTRDWLSIAAGGVFGFGLAGIIFLIRRRLRRSPVNKSRSVSGLDAAAARLSSWTGRISAPQDVETIVTHIEKTPLPPVKLKRNMTLAEKYTLMRFIGFDGTVEIWKAHDKTLNRPVLLKRLYSGHKSQGAEERAKRLQEARTAAKLHHPSISELYEILDISSGLFIVYEYCTGKSVYRILEEKGELSASQVRDILTPVCRALEHAHQLGISHGGLSPERIVVTNNGYIKISDFVLAKTTGEGSERYSAPEAKRGDPTPVSDIYSLGLCCYEMLTGELPHVGTRETDPVIDAALERTLDLDYRTRMKDANDFIRMLRKLAEDIKAGSDTPPKKSAHDDGSSGTETEATA